MQSTRSWLSVSGGWQSAWKTSSNGHQRDDYFVGSGADFVGSEIPPP